MSSIVRRGTFTYSESKMGDTSNVSGIDKQNIMRLRINRVALVQELRIEHIINHLMQAGIISDDDRRRIEYGTTPADKARRLIDVLPSKTHIPDWYQTFREAMLNPEGTSADVKKRYRSLVEFLDNTVIHRPTSQASKFASTSDSSSMKLPHFEPLPGIKDEKSHKKTQNVLILEDSKKKSRRADQESHDGEKGARDVAPERDDKIATWSHSTSDSMTLVKGFFQQWVPTPDNFRSLIQVPEEHFKQLQESTYSDDKAQLSMETLALERIRRLEIVAVMARRKQLPQGFELCMCEAVHEILFDQDNYHWYFKYLKNLEESEVNLLLDIVDSYASVMSNMDPSKGSSENTQQAIKLGFCLIDFLAEYGYFKQAELIMTVLLMVLNQSHNMDIWMAKFKGFVKLMHFRNMNYEFMKVQHAYNMANEMIWQIEMMSFGQDIIDKTQFHIELSQLMLEYGSTTSSFQWALKALKAVKIDNPANIIDAMCAAVMAYCAKWMIRRAETLAVEVVQQAKHHFGTRHPLFVKALLHFCHFSSEFKQDVHGLEVAKYTLEVAKKTYACDTIQVAHAHRAVCKAMLVLQKFDDLSYHFHATMALQMARTLLPEQHPMLYLFLHTSASSLQWKALHSSKDMQDGTLRLAETEAKEALDVVAMHYGEISLRTAQMLSLLGQIYSKMEQMQMAEEMLCRSVLYMKLCQAENSNFLLLALATLGTFYKILQKPREAIIYFKEVVKQSDVGVYLKWVHVCYEHLITTLQALNSNKEADEYQIQLSHWLRDNQPDDRVVELAELHEKAKPYQKFIEDFNVWEKRGRKVLDLAKQKLSLEKAE